MNIHRYFISRFKARWYLCNICSWLELPSAEPWWRLRLCLCMICDGWRPLVEAGIVFCVWFVMVGDPWWRLRLCLCMICSGNKNTCLGLFVWDHSCTGCHNRFLGQNTVRTLSILSLCILYDIALFNLTTFIVNLIWGIVHVCWVTCRPSTP